MASSLKQAGLELHVETANGQIGSWLAEVAQQRIHGTTGEKAQVRLDKERLYRQPLPTRRRQQWLLFYRSYRAAWFPLKVSSIG